MDVGGETQINTDSQVGKPQDLVKISDTDAEINERVTYDDDDFYSDWRNENPNYIELKGTVADSTGTGVEMKEDTITITKAGVYALSGKLDNGQIIVDEQDKGTVKLVLNGVEIHATDSAPIYVKKAGKTIITLEDGTENMISDGENYVFEDDTTDEPNAAIFSKDNLTINGTGKLTVYGNYNNGISSKDDLKITGGQINIYSADDGLMGRDLVAVKDGTITIKSAGDGIKSSKGLIVLEGDIFNIQADADGIQGETAVYILGGDYSIFSGGGSVDGSDKTNTKGNPMGSWRDNNTVANTEQETETKSTKGIKSSTLIAIEGGTFNLDTSDDAIHSDDSIIITDGDITIATGDDGIHADKSIIINGGKHQRCI
ncbi:protein of unknown function [Anaerovirgula multivorans]|uniref:Carbohydrate-binding domain-containing protein n=1 Tax=Anaerovirgula multivorans TaxID=312168 RepID=A0A239IHQ1_9FIRM|nr:carbohydrate-binding domain-containing protein [Anaerovirgula multivorans]SNS92942.1 protein of unknown function [Anaerovirgula multivorans]